MPRPPAFRDPMRLFVAVYPPPEIVGQLLSAVPRLQLPPGARILPPEQVHLTLQFIGDCARKEAARVKETTQRAGDGCRGFRLTAQRIAAWPQEGSSKRLLAAETDAPAELLELQRRLAHRLSRSPRRDPGGAFVPHITLVRFAQPVLLSAESAVSIPSFSVQEYVLMESELRASGAVHHRVEAFPLVAG